MGAEDRRADNGAFGGYLSIDICIPDSVHSSGGILCMPHVAGVLS